MRHRFHSICPYFAMFPESFAEKWISRFTKPLQTVMDPFSGRGTAPFQAVLMERNAVGADINPVAFVLTSAKVDSPTLGSVVKRLNLLRGRFSPEPYDEERSKLPPFFGRAFHPETLQQLLFLRDQLEWRRSRVDRFIAALALGSLHGEMDKSTAYFSNQMPRTISTKPSYSLRFWEARRLWPQKRNVFEILRRRAAFRFESPRPNLRGKAFLSDVRQLQFTAQRLLGSVDMVLTSPPYLDVTNFEEDQWLRLWLLGGPPRPTRSFHSHDDRHEYAGTYWAFICDAWRSIRPFLKERATLVCRIGGRDTSTETLSQALCTSMQFLAERATLKERSVSYFERRRQTDAFRPGSIGCRFEIDFRFALRQ